MSECKFKVGDKVKFIPEKYMTGSKSKYTLSPGVVYEILHMKPSCSGEAKYVIGLLNDEKCIFAYWDSQFEKVPEPEVIYENPKNKLRMLLIVE